MVKYKINLYFKDNEKSLNEIIIESLKMNLQKRLDMTFNSIKKDLLCSSINCFQNKVSN